jgi:hypothetical protein
MAALAGVVHVAKALPATITNALSAINKGVLFMTTSLLRAPEHKRPDIVGGSK